MVRWRSGQNYYRDYLTLVDSKHRFRNIHRSLLRQIERTFSHCCCTLDIIFHAMPRGNLKEKSTQTFEVCNEWWGKGSLSTWRGYWWGLQYQYQNISLTGTRCGMQRRSRVAAITITLHFVESLNNQQLNILLYCFLYNCITRAIN